MIYQPKYYRNDKLFDPETHSKASWDRKNLTVEAFDQPSSICSSADGRDSSSWRIGRVQAPV